MDAYHTALQSAWSTSQEECLDECLKDSCVLHHHDWHHHVMSSYAYMLWVLPHASHSFEYPPAPVGTEGVPPRLGLNNDLWSMTNSSGLLLVLLPAGHHP
jgi:hypothetical protein